MTALPSLTALKTFTAVGQSLSFTKAADRLGVTQSAVSRQIRQLEEALDLQLFARTGNKVVLTAAGIALHERLAEAFDLIEEAVVDVRGTRLRQKITILAPPTFASRWLTRRLAQFRQRYPNMDLALHVRPDDNVRFDCVVRFGRDSHERHTSTRLLIEQHVAVCAPELVENVDRLRAGSLLYVMDEGRLLPTWENWFAATTYERRDLPQSSMQFATLDMVIEAAESGAGLAVIDRNMIEAELMAGSLVQIDPVVVTGPIGYWLDIGSERLGRSRVVQFTRWLKQVSATGKVDQRGSGPV